MKKVLKWSLIVLAVIAVVAFAAFLYFIPPFFVSPPETFAAGQADVPPRVDGIADPAERAIAEHGRYIVMTTPCNGCHGTPGPQGPDRDKFLAGGTKFLTREGVFVSRNLTPDRDTGLARRTDAEVKRVLRSGVFPDGHVVPHSVMPWANFSNWTEEDRHAVVVYLRHLKPVPHLIPDPGPATPLDDPAANEQVHGGKDYGTTPK